MAGLAPILLFVGAKMLIEERMAIPIGISLGVIVAILAAMVGASLLWPQVKRADEKR
jgi:predicted tellurium resistance membrane protein TerC